MDRNLDYARAGRIPDTILRDYDTDYWLICWKSDAAGVINFGPTLVQKEVVAARFPHLLATWEANKRKEAAEARKLHARFFDFGKRLWAPDTKPKQRGVACSQDLLPGMKQHWGELRACETHAPDHYGEQTYMVCEGCRVAHHALRTDDKDARLLMMRGARMPVCADCAAKAVEKCGVEYRGCSCGERWMCLDCREDDLRKFAQAREASGGHGKCAECLDEGNLVKHVELCVYCERYRVYAMASWE